MTLASGDGSEDVGNVGSDGDDIGLMDASPIEPSRCAPPSTTGTPNHPGDMGQIDSHIVCCAF